MNKGESPATSHSNGSGAHDANVDFAYCEERKANTISLHSLSTQGVGVVEKIESDSSQRHTAKGRQAQICSYTVRRQYAPLAVAEQWNRLARDAVSSPYLEIFTT